MLVDDEEFCLSSMNSMLFNLGVDTNKRVDYCISGHEALDRLKEAYKKGVKYELILLDFNMPQMNGIELTYRIRQYLKSEYKL